MTVGVAHRDALHEIFSTGLRHADSWHAFAATILPHVVLIADVLPPKFAHDVLQAL
jgi:hypothetical protein